MFKNERRGIVKAGLLAALMMLVIMLPSMLQNRGVYIIRGDYVDQYIPRLKYIYYTKFFGKVKGRGKVNRKTSPIFRLIFTFFVFLIFPFRFGVFTPAKILPI